MNPSIAKVSPAAAPSVIEANAGAQKYLNRSNEPRQPVTKSTPLTTLNLPILLKRRIETAGAQNLEKSNAQTLSTMLQSMTVGTEAPHVRPRPQPRLSVQPWDSVDAHPFAGQSPVVHNYRSSLDTALAASASSPTTGASLSDRPSKTDQVDPHGFSLANLYHTHWKSQEVGEQSKPEGTAQSPKYPSVDHSGRRSAKSYKPSTIPADVHNSSAQTGEVPTLHQPSQARASTSFRPRPAFTDEEQMRSDMSIFNSAEHLGTPFNFQPHSFLKKDPNSDQEVTDEELAKTGELLLGPFASPKERQTQIGNFIRESRKNLKNWKNIENSTGTANPSRNGISPLSRFLATRRESEYAGTRHSPFAVPMDPVTATDRRRAKLAGKKARKHFPREYEDDYSKIVERGETMVKSIAEMKGKSTAEALGSVVWTPGGEHVAQSLLNVAESVIRGEGCQGKKRRRESQAERGIEKQKDGKTSAKAYTPSLLSVSSSSANSSSESGDDWEMVGHANSPVEEASGEEEEWIDVQEVRPKKQCLKYFDV